MQVTIEQFLTASYPCLLIESMDFDGVEKKVKEAIREIDRKGIKVDENGVKITPMFATWTITKGLTIAPAFSTDPKQSRVLQKNFNQALEYIATAPESICMLMYNIRGFFSGAVQSIVTNVQALLDASMEAKDKHSCIILVGAGFEVPPEIANFVQHVDFPLPNKKELMDICMDKIIVPNYDGLNINVPDQEERPKRNETMSAFFKRRLLELNKDKVEEAAKSASGLTPIAAENAYALSIIVSGELNTDIIQDQKRQAIRNSEVLEFFSPEDTMNDVGGFGEFKKWLDMRHRAFTDEARDFGVTPPKGILLVGISGGGKSLLSKSISSSLRIPLLRFDLSKVFHHLVGASENRMRTALKVIEAVAPAVVWADEIEKALAGSDASRSTDSGVSSRVLGQFLQWRQETKAPVFLCVTCNNIKAIPPEFYRPGRIDAIFYVGLPSFQARMEIASIHLRKRKRDPKTVDLKKIAFATEGFTGAEIELAIIEALFAAFSNNKADVTTELILEAVKAIVPHSVRNKEQMEELEEWASNRAKPVEVIQTDSSKNKRIISAVKRTTTLDN